MKEQSLFRLNVGRAEADNLEKAIRNAYSNAEQSFSIGQFSYDGPAPGAFGFGEGFLELIGESWDELMKIPEAVVILSQGIADYIRLRGNTQSISIKEVNGQISVSFESMGGAAMTDPAEIAAALVGAVQNIKSKE